MFTKLSLLSPESVSFDEVEGLRILQSFNYDYKRAEESILSEIMDKVNHSEEGFWDSLKDGATWLWNKIKELWNTFWTWLKRVFGVKDTKNGTDKYSVFNYGQFPTGYRPSEFENNSCKLPGWNAGDWSCCYMRGTRCLNLFLSRVDAIASEMSGGNIYQFYQSFIKNIGNIQDDKWPIDEFVAMYGRLTNIFNGIVTIDIDTAIDRFNKQPNIKNPPGMTNINNITAMLGNISNFVTFPRAPQLYESIDPYSANSGWNAGNVYRDYLEDNRGRLTVTLKQFTAAFERFKRDCAGALFTAATAYFNKPNAQPKLNVVTNQFSGLTGNDDHVANQYARMCIINEMFRKLNEHIAIELANIKLRLELNAQAISNDVNYQKAHSGILGGRTN